MTTRSWTLLVFGIDRKWAKVQKKKLAKVQWKKVVVRLVPGNVAVEYECRPMMRSEVTADFGFPVFLNRIFLAEDECPASPWQRCKNWREWNDGEW